ncbi:glycosyltransferase family 2 protein [Flavivirga sp. 57AJ16]|uniref:glycosyltransferase family 2 protein n=1 Tax=Flavivirga sp. 57AJ16 TaxID=3025307 RepID=UPI002366EE77|nr:glycosyltransferase family 2 protein [Flavivirga sp. 57AJ16]MDD7885336.1 glycosyltransferase [Flavivirga sp. 57AJ16]
MPFFSVIIPLYNKEKFIGNTLNSVLNQSFENFEVIIIDDGSTDKSLEKVKQISDRRITIYTQNNLGVSRARNLGIEKAKSKYISLLDADDIWKPNHLQEHFNNIKKFPFGSLFCNAYELKLSKTCIIKAIYNTEKKDTPHVINNYFEASTIHPIGWTSAIVFNKNDFYDIGVFNPEFTSGQDLDLLIRFGLKKMIIFNPTITSCYDKTVMWSLSKENHQESKRALFNSFKTEENTNKSLKKYLNLNRYSLAIQCKLVKNKRTFKKLYPEIDKSLLNLKQKLLLITPYQLVILIKKVHLALIKNHIYISSYK